MEKLGVAVEPEANEKRANSGGLYICPNCGRRVDPNTNVPKCPFCGTEPFEPRLKD